MATNMLSIVMKYEKNSSRQMQYVGNGKKRQVFQGVARSKASEV
jgi:hypothetical protein